MTEKTRKRLGRLMSMYDLDEEQRELAVRYAEFVEDTLKKADSGELEFTEEEGYYKAQVPLPSFVQGLKGVSMVLEDPYELVQRIASLLEYDFGYRYMVYLDGGSDLVITKLGEGTYPPTNFEYLDKE